MKENKPLLTICIPTYNRKEKIQKQVRKILPQLTDEVILVVNDNNSSYDIYELFTEEEKAQFVLNVNCFNIGGDANIAKSFLCCRTKWLWTLSDDDSLTQDAIRIVLETIKSNDKSIFINFNRPNTITTHNLKEFLNTAKVNYGALFWMSICVYNMNYLKDYMHHYFPYISVMQPSVVLLVRSLAEHDSDIVFTKNKIIEYGDTDISWNRSNFIYASLFLMDIFRDLRKDMRKTIFKSITNMCYSNILQKYRKDRKFFDAVELFVNVIYKYGILNTININLKETVRFFVRLIGLFLLKKYN